MFLKNRKISSKIKRSEVIDYAALKHLAKGHTTRSQVEHSTIEQILLQWRAMHTFEFKRAETIETLFGGL